MIILVFLICTFLVLQYPFLRWDNQNCTQYSNCRRTTSIYIRAIYIRALQHPAILLTIPFLTEFAFFRTAQQRFYVLVERCTRPLKSLSWTVTPRLEPSLCTYSYDFCPNNGHHLHLNFHLSHGIRSPSMKRPFGAHHSQLVFILTQSTSSTNVAGSLLSSSFFVNKLNSQHRPLERLHCSSPTLLASCFS